MGLHAQTPARVCLAVGHGCCGVGSGIGPVHGLQVEVFKVQRFVQRRLGARLRIHQLEFLARGQHALAAALGAHAQPVNAFGRQNRAVGFHGNGEAKCVQGFDQSFVHLQQGLATGQHHKAVRGVGGWPKAGNGGGQGWGAVKLAAVRAIGADKVGVAELANGRAAVFFAAAPQVASGETAKHGGLPCIGAFTLQGVEHFFHAVRHAAIFAASYVSPFCGPIGA